MLNPFKRLGKRQLQQAESLSQVDWDSLVRSLANQANEGAKWRQILAAIQARGLTPEPVAQWMTTHGSQWVQQPDPEFGQGLLRLSEVAQGSLAEISKTLGQALIQGPSALSSSLEPLATSKPADGSASPQNLKQSSALEPDPAVLAAIEAYSRGDFSFADLNTTSMAGQSFAPKRSANQPQPMPTAPPTDPPEKINLSPTSQSHSLTVSEWLGNKLYAQGRYEEALASYDRTITLQPDSAMAWYNRGLILNHLGRYEEALVSYDHAITRQPGLAWAWSNRGNTLEHLGRYEEALVSYDQAVTLQPDLALAWCKRGDTLADLGRYEESLASYDRAVTLQPNLTMAWGNRGNTLADLGRYEEALASFDQTITLQPNLALAWCRRGDTLADLGRYEEALANYDQAITLQPNLAEAWRRQGNTLADLGRYEAALVSYDQAITLQPDLAEAWRRQGVALDDLRRYAAALTSLNKAVTLQPGYATAWVNRGVTLYHLGPYEEALASYDQAITLQPDDATAWMNRGVTLYHLRRYEEALASYNQAITLQPDLALAWSNRGGTLDYLGRYEEALASYDQAISLQPDLAEAWMNRGVTLSGSGRYEEALASHDQAITLQPDDAMAWRNRGICVYGLPRYHPDDGSLFSQKMQQALDSRSRYALTSFSDRDVDAIYGHFLKSLEQSKALLLKTFADTDNPQLLALIQQPPPPKLKEVIRAPISAKLQAIVQQPVSATVLQKIAEVAARQPGRLRPELQIGGYKGKLNSYKAELGEHSQDEPKKAICKDTHPEGWGILHRAIGRAHYLEGRRQANPQGYWEDASDSFGRALKTLQSPKFETLYFETLQDLIRVLVDLKENQEAQILQQRATNYIQRALAEPNRRQTERQQLGLWLAKFEQLTVDAEIQAGNLHQALSNAEMAKNVCLRWLLDLGEVPEVTFEQMQALLDNHTAALYWHLSPAALTTFLLLPGASEPLVIAPPALPPGPEETLADDKRSLGLKQILHWEDWLSQWNRDYENYSSAQSKTDKTLDLTAWRREHPWRTQMVSRLESLGHLLNVEAIHAALKDSSIQRLRLIPHRDLHRLPLHTFFDQYDCTYLPSAKVGLDRLPQAEPPAYKDLLMAENPKSTATVKTLTQKLNELPFAEVEAELVRQQFREAGGEPPGRITTLENQQVPCDRLLSALGQAHQVFHFTGHGLYNSRNPAQSCLFLTGGDRLTLLDIVHPDPALGYHDLSRYQLVFLAACETGVSGNQTITDDYVGLVSAFLKAKAGCVVSTLWRIESGSSLIFVSQFYQALLAGAPPAQALHKAQDFLKTATYDHIRTTFQGYIALLDRSKLHPDRKASLQLVLDYQLRYLESKQQANSTMEANSPSMLPLYSHPYHWAAYTVSGL